MQLATFSELLKLKLAKNETLSFAHPENNTKPSGGKGMPP